LKEKLLIRDAIKRGFENYEENLLSLGKVEIGSLD
jgi:hypothetical protein